MKLAQREIVVIALGAAIALGALAYRKASSGSLAADADAATIAGAMARIHEYELLKTGVGRLAEELKIAVPEGSAADQETLIRQELAQKIQQGGLALGSIRRLETGAVARGAALKPIQFRLELTGPFESLVKLVYTLEHSPAPFLVRELSVAAPGGAGSGRGAPGGGGGQPPPPAPPPQPSPPTMPPPAPGGGMPPGTSEMGRAMGMTGPPPGLPSGGMTGMPPGGMPPGMTGMPPGMEEARRAARAARRGMMPSGGMPPGMPSGGMPPGMPMGGGGPGGGSPGGGVPGGSPGQVKATMQVQAYLFPAPEAEPLAKPVSAAAVNPAPATPEAPATLVKDARTSAAADTKTSLTTRLKLPAAPDAKTTSTTAPKPPAAGGGKKS